MLMKEAFRTANAALEKALYHSDEAGRNYRLSRNYNKMGQPEKAIKADRKWLLHVKAHKAAMSLAARN